MIIIIVSCQRCNSLHLEHQSCRLLFSCVTYSRIMLTICGRPVETTGSTSGIDFPGKTTLYGCVNKEIRSNYLLRRSTAPIQSLFGVLKHFANSNGFDHVLRARNCSIIANVISPMNNHAITIFGKRTVQFDAHFFCVISTRTGIQPAKRSLLGQVAVRVSRNIRRNIPIILAANSCNTTQFARRIRYNYMYCCSRALCGCFCSSAYSRQFTAVNNNSGHHITLFFDLF